MIASIRARLTLWNGGVLLAVLAMFAGASYLWLRLALFEQLDRALGQQVSAAAFTIAALNESASSDAVAAPPDADTFMRRVALDLEAHGLFTTQPPDSRRILITSPIRIDEEDEHETPAEARAAAKPDIEWGALAQAIKAQRDDDDAVTVAGRRAGSRVRIKRFPIGRDSLTLVATQSLRKTADLLRTARVAAVIALPTALLVALALGYLLARGALDPVAAMTAEANRIGSHNAHERLSVINADDEFGQLASTINEVLSRLDGALEQQRRFTADASHELRTPVALIRAESDVALLDGASTERELRSALTVVQDASRQLGRIVDDMFLLARADAGQELLAFRELALDELVTAAVQSARTLALPKALRWETAIVSPAPFSGDPDLLRRAIGNLLDNAIKFAPENSVVAISLLISDADYKIVVRDNGPGVAVEDEPHVFTRFFRGDAARTRSKSSEATGAGLGLAIAREIVEQHGGTLQLHSRSQGASFEILLPTREQDG